MAPIEIALRRLLNRVSDSNKCIIVRNLTDLLKDIDDDYTISCNEAIVWSTPSAMDNCDDDVMDVALGVGLISRHQGRFKKNIRSMH